MQYFLLAAVVGVTVCQPMFFKALHIGRRLVPSEGYFERSEVEVVECDNITRCPNDRTCCQLTDTGYFWCCSLKDAVCCANGSYCCPKSSTCDATTITCNSGGRPIDWSVIGRDEQTKDASRVICGDGYECPDGSTCCKSEKAWRCCPFLNAACCEDMIHCCRPGETCDMKKGACKKEMFTDWVVKSPARQIKKRKPERLGPAEGWFERSEVKDVECDNITRCPDDSTCCKVTVTGFFWCCSLKDAVCCANGTYCCPKTSTCDVTTGTCNSGERHKDWSVIGGDEQTKDASRVICGDGYECPDGSTCCKSEKAWRCCPFLNAVCCEDMIHCCRPGETCDMIKGACKKEMFTDWVVKSPARQINKRNPEKLFRP